MELMGSLIAQASGGADWVSIGFSAGGSVLAAGLGYVLWRLTRRENRIETALDRLYIRQDASEREQRADYRHLENKVDLTKVLAKQVTENATGLARLEGAVGKREGGSARASLRGAQ